MQLRDKDVDDDDVMRAQYLAVAGFAWRHASSTGCRQQDQLVTIKISS